MRLVVVGAGFWGVAAALLAQRRGFDVTLLDSGSRQGASRAASGYFDHRWYGKEAPRALRSMSTAEMFGLALETTGAVLTGSCGKTSGNTTLRTFNPRAFLALRPPTQVTQVERIERRFVGAGLNNVVVVHCAHATLHVDAVVIVAGVGTDPLLERSNLPPLGIRAIGGSALILEGVQMTTAQPLWRHTNPYRHYALRHWPSSKATPTTSTVRLCATIEPDPSKRAAAVASMRKVMERETSGGIVVDDVHGMRPVLDRPTVKLLAPGVVAASGGGRVGAGLAFWAATEALSLLEAR